MINSLLDFFLYRIVTFFIDNLLILIIFKIVIVTNFVRLLLILIKLLAYFENRYI